MWNSESSKYFIKKITKHYGREIIQEGSVSVLGLADHFDEMVAKAMNVDKGLITLARQWRVALERAAFTEGVDKVKEVLGREQEPVPIHQENTNETVEEIEMRIEKEQITESKNIKEVRSTEMTRQNAQHQGMIDSTTKKDEKNKIPEVMEDIQLVENSIEIHPCKNEIEDRLEQLVEIGKSRCGS